MALREIIRMGDARLLRIAPPVDNLATPALRALVSDMFETMEEAGGVGLAAPQLGLDQQLIVFGFDHADRYPDAPAVPRTVLINPSFEALGDETEDGWEGCLSIPGLRGLVRRHKRIRYAGVDAEGRPVEREAEGFHARVVQHEIDHLLGTLYPMRMHDLRQFGFTDLLFPEAAASEPQRQAGR